MGMVWAGFAAAVVEVRPLPDPCPARPVCVSQVGFACPLQVGGHRKTVDAEDYR